MNVSHRIKELRKKRGWSAAKLAEACKDVGAPELNRPVIANIESRRRKTVTLEEVFTLALVLDVAPIHLFMPVDEVENHDLYEVAPDSVWPLKKAREWARGHAFLDSQDPRTYFSEVPREDFQAPPPSTGQIEEHSDDVRAYRELVAKTGFVDLTEGDERGVDPEKK